jgi:hydrogen peroxide-dependent heme synthase
MSELPPATLEGWYVLHQVVEIDYPALAGLDASARRAVAEEAESLLARVEAPAEAGWSAAFQIVGGGADLMLVHFRESLDALGRVELEVRRSRTGLLFRHVYDYTSVTEVGLYAATAEAAQAAEPRSAEFRRQIEELAAAERASPHVHTRLYPEVPADMRYVSFYPMSKRRSGTDNWYSLSVADRSRLMQEHGLSGRRYAGRIFQVITGSVGFDDWEWGVTLFARDPLEFKRIVTEMRYDEASARYGEFGEFFTGMRIEPAQLRSMLEA